MLDELTPMQWAELLAFEGIEPGGAARDDMRAAKIAAMFGGAFLKTKGGASPRFEDFIPVELSEPKPVDPVALSKQIRAALGGAVKSKAEGRRQKADR